MLQAYMSILESKLIKPIKQKNHNLLILNKNSEVSLGAVVDRYTRDRLTHRNGGEVYFTEYKSNPVTSIACVKNQQGVARNFLLFLWGRLSKQV